MSLKLLLLTLAIVAISADTINSVDYTCADCKCVIDNNTTQFNYDDPVALCVHYVACSETSKTCDRMRSAYALKVDDYAVVELQGGQTFYALNETVPPQYDTVKIVIQVHGNYTSDPIDFIKFSGGNPNFYANVFSAVIGIRNGTVYNITWDNQCGLCEEDTDKCTKLTLNTETGRTTQICNNVDKCKEKSNSAQCDPKIYISWIGSDVKNQKMTSAGMRLGRFRSFDMKDVYNAAENLTNVSSSASASTPTPTPISS